jgi:hypothetical protein
MTIERPIYVLRIRAEPHAEQVRALRWLLKSMLRQCGWKCLSIDEEKHGA